MLTKAQKKAAKFVRSAEKSAKRSEQRFFNGTRNKYRDFNKGHAIEVWIETEVECRSESRF